MISKYFAVILAVFFSLVLSGCASIPLTSLPRLAMIDIEAVALSQVKIAVRIPEDYKIVGNEAKLSLDFENNVSGKTLKAHFKLPMVKAPLSKYLKKQEKRGTQIYQFYFDDEMTKSAHELRKKLYAMKAVKKSNNDMSISASIRPCLKQGASINQDMHMTFYIKTSPRKDFYTLFKKRTLKFKFDNEQDRQKMYCKAKAG